MLKAFLAGTIAAAAALAAASPAVAQARTESVQPVRAIYEAGRCIARDRAVAAELLRLLPIGGGEVPHEAKQVARSRCAAAALDGDAAMLLRGAIAQELYLTDFREFGVEPRNRSSWIDLALPVEADGDGANDANARLYRWADCVVRNDTVRTERLFRTQPGSSQETKALQSMQPYMGACLNLDAQLMVAPSELRSLFAQSAYHNSYRYWTGELRQAGGEAGVRYAAIGEGSVLDVVSCRRLDLSGTRVGTHKVCMREGEWRKSEQRIRDAVYRMMRQTL